MAEVTGNVVLSKSSEGYYVEFVNCMELCKSENKLHNKKKLLITQVYVGDRPLGEFVDLILDGKEEITFEITYNCCGEGAGACDTCNPEQFLMRSADQIKTLVGK